MKGVLCLLAIVLLFTVDVYAVKNNKHDGVLAELGSHSQIGRSIQDLQNTKLGKLFFEFAEVSMMTTGAVESLLDGIRAFGRQIEARLDLENELFAALEGEHNSKSLAFQSLISQAELDINREKKRENQELVPRSLELDDTLLNLKGKKEDNKQSVTSAITARENQHDHFTDATNEFTEAIRGIDEALELLEELQESGDVRASFIEVSQDQKKKITKVLKEVKVNTEKFGHQFSSFIQALTQLTEGQNFKDRQVFKDINDFLNSLRSNIQEALQKAYDDEAQQENNHEHRLSQLADESKVFDVQYSEAFVEREDKGIRIRDTQAFITTRELDAEAYNERFTIENNSFAQNNKIHDDLVADINEELSTLEKVLDVIQTPPFQDFLAGKMSF